MYSSESSERDRLPTPVLLGFPGGSDGKESTCNVGDLGSIPGLGRSTGEGIGYPLQYSWASLVAQLGKNLPAMWETWVQSLGWEDPLEKGVYSLQYSGLENSMDCIVQGVTKSQTRLSNLHFHFHFFTCRRQTPALEMRLHFAFWDFTQNGNIL